MAGRPRRRAARSFAGGPDAPSGAGLPSPAEPEDPPGDPESVARVICLRLLDRRAYSRAELAGKLRERGIPDDAAERVLDRYVEVGLINDAALAAGLAGAQHRERGLARRAVAQKLRQRGLQDEIDDALVGIDADSERERAHDLVAKRRRALDALPTEVQFRRLVGLLARKGYPSGVCYAVVREALALDEAPS